MTLGGANVWTNFSYGYRNESPSGWLLSPDRSRLILFTRKPMAIKSSTQMYLDNAWDKWHDLQLEGWTFEELELPESV